MSTKKDIKYKLGRFNLNSRLKKLKRKVVTHNFKSAKTAGIIFNNPDDQSFEDIKQFMSFLSQTDIKVIALAYIPTKKVPENYLMRKGFNFYCKSDLNWYLKPKNEIIEQFINQDFDILFDLSTTHCFTTYYVGSLSKASFKVGRQYDMSYHDLSFEIKQNNRVDFLIEQIKHYLNILNN